ncbi:putative 60S ribosomal protein L24 [Gregarina niphandrodes]|uniref:60S ribosomal protein L24 n=1 Tax=Gregarina niphandrodes TaxID=110365 RepID=A0A023B2Q2_GRENI|nr:putative 60S ribosomal protein L24 [Gregarina niphandrodes]EZG55074.1 putative 60S ribosomal protein L24 [Gregarina niphandrodes]|eukprot:XP_011131800.1 putative 60S ribosomal protein L24 [Gregarina niphandrodes]
MASKDVTTTLKLETCSYSEMKIYPGRGQVFISRDAKTHVFQTSKVESLYHQKKKPAKLRWTQAWRRNNKKAVANTGIGKKRTKTTVRSQKAIAGMSLDDIEKKKAEAAAKRTNSKRSVALPGKKN